MSIIDSIQDLNIFYDFSTKSDLVPKKSVVGLGAEPPSLLLYLNWEVLVAQGWDKGSPERTELNVKIRRGQRSVVFGLEVLSSRNEEEQNTRDWKGRGDIWGLPACPSSSLQMTRWLHFWEVTKGARNINLSAAHPLAVMRLEDQP